MELDGLLSTVNSSTFCDLDLWPFDLISMSQDPEHTWPNCGEITSNSYKDIVFTRFFCLLPAVTLTCDLLIPKGNQQIYEPIQLWIKFGEIPLISFWDMVLTRFSGHCLLWPWPLTFWPQKLISKSMSPSTSVTEIVLNSLH